MSVTFDHNGDLWVEVVASKFAPEWAMVHISSMEVGPELNLTAYIRSLNKPQMTGGDRVVGDGVQAQ